MWQIVPGYKGSALYEESLAVRDKSLITASGAAPVDFAKRIFEQLDVYSDAVLASWFQLFKSGDPKFFDSLLQAAGVSHFKPPPSRQG